ncbi:hypothetical protein EJ05DRAFT_541167 [Pseudovirgaria hyperparasitica]|uniref:Exocyst complex component EXO84 n=1 Tax=Pseudovirgaria hyperparasitica TaxID=470096 RepID=A0A6A6VVK2_9PEZI|nr:uncharacterized protein EJ05DRAFT_541167 [Pseudovirgaria hyperparasitica]KAF2754602.1 hypothetical protein EJ05DRAFT_541167 [Pseudovirgaria hyperparasitica]
MEEKSREKESKGISLRKKKKTKPQISAPKQISAPLPQGVPVPGGTIPRPRQDGSPAPSSGSGRDAGVRPRPRPQQSDVTADLVKRRYSTRFTQMPDFNGDGVPPMPSVPAIPKQSMQPPPSRDGRASAGEGEKKIRVDPKALRDPNLRPEQYISSLLSEASEAEIMAFQQELRKAKNRMSTDLQHNVYQNRTQFIKISKEAEKLKSEMRTLRTLMSDLTDTLGQATHAGIAGEKQTARNRANRSSVANLEALWNTHLQTLWKRVEGSQKFLPATPGRHIVHESSRWVELNRATWKARRRVHLILLNDHLLVAHEKQRTDAPAPNNREAKRTTDKNDKQLVAQRCFPLQDVQIADLASSGTNGSRVEPKENSANAINVRVGNDSFTYAVPPMETKEKITLLSTFRKAVEDLRKTREAETEERGKAQDSVNYYATRDLNILKKTELLESLSDKTANQRSSLFLDVDGKQQSIRWVEAQLDELDINIALQHFEEAVANLERLKTLAKSVKGNSVAQDLISFKVNERAGKLASILIKQLTETHSWSSATKKHVDWLVRLGFEDHAREAYLEARSDIIKQRSRQCIFDGDLQHYIYQVSFIYFTVIKNTVSTYQACFPVVMMSACVKWAKEHVDEFNIILIRQLSSVDKGNDIWNACMNRAKDHAGLLSEVGLDFREMIGRASAIAMVNGIGTHNGDVGLGLSS